MSRESNFHQKSFSSSLNGYLSVYDAAAREATKPHRPRGKRRSPAAETGESPVQKKSFLIADDDQAFLNTLAGQLTEEGFGVRTAADNFSLQAVIKTVSPDVMLIDYYLPEQDGIQIIKRLRQVENLANTTIILMSGHAQAKLLADHEEIPFVEKPFGIEKLLALIDRLEKENHSGKGGDGEKGYEKGSTQKTPTKNFRLPRSPMMKLLTDMTTFLFTDPG